MSHILRMRLTGFLVSLVLTIAAYLIIINPELFHFEVGTAITAILILALVQSIVQLIFFINVWKEKELWNLGVFISTVSIIFIIIFFSIWIMDHLNYNMR